MSSDKRELLKLRQGLVSEEESVLEVEEKPYIEKPVGMAAVSNFVYHHKIHIVIVAFLLAVAGVLAYFTLSSEKADITILFIAGDEATAEFFHFEASSLQAAFETFTPDFSGNGSVYAECLVIDLSLRIGGVPRNPEAVQGARIKLFGEMQAGNALIFVSNREALKNIPGEEMLEDFYMNLEERYPGNPNVTDGVFYRIKGSPLEAAAAFEQVSLPDDLYLVVRENVGTFRLSANRVAQIKENSLIVLDNITAG